MKNMPIKDLGKYLKGLQKDNSFGDDVVVEIGTLKQESGFFKYSIYTAVFLLLSLGGYFATDSFLNKTVTLAIDSKIDAETVTKLLSNDGINIISLEKDQNTYLVKAKTKNITFLLESLRKNKEFSNVELR